MKTKIKDMILKKQWLLYVLYIKCKLYSVYISTPSNQKEKANGKLDASIDLNRPVH